MSFGATVEKVGRGWGQTFFPFECGFETFFDEAFAKMGDGVGVTVKLFGDLAITDSTVFVFIDGEQNIGVFDSLGVAFAFGNELGEFEAFVGGQDDFINLWSCAKFMDEGRETPII